MKVEGYIDSDEPPEELLELCKPPVLTLDNCDQMQEVFVTLHKLMPGDFPIWEGYDPEIVKKL
jgi:hypothetical protein